jgi:hypothetical protein
VQKEVVLASARSLVTVEEVVGELEPRPGAIVLPTRCVTGVAEAPHGAHPLQLVTSDREREEAELEARLRERRRVTRTNPAAVVSPKGGFGKTTCSYLIGDLLASRPKLRVLAIDTNPDFGTLGKLAPDAYRSEHQLTDVVGRTTSARRPSSTRTCRPPRPGSTRWRPPSGRR